MGAGERRTRPQTAIHGPDYITTYLGNIFSLIYYKDLPEVTKMTLNPLDYMCTPAYPLC